MRIRIVNMIELIVALAVGMAFVRFDDPNATWNSTPILMYVNDVIVDFLAGCALVSGIGLVVESIRSRGRGGPWGVGRWAWALSAIGFMVGGGSTAISLPISEYAQNSRLYMDFTVKVIFATAVSSSTSDFVRFLVIFLLTSRLARLPRDAAPDYREWSGRIFGGFLFIWEAVVYIHGIIDPNYWLIY